MSSAQTSTENHSSPSPSVRSRHLRTTFSSLQNRNFRIFASSQVVTNTGVWVQRIAQDWLVLELTGSATAVGVAIALQFVPTLLIGLAGGWIADRYPRRRILLATQAGMGATAAALAVLTLTHHVALWHVYLIAFGLGLVVAVDNPTRQSFIHDMVGPERLRNAISINSSVYQLGALIGPAISGALIGAVGPGYPFAIAAVLYLAPGIALASIRTGELVAIPVAHTESGRLGEVLPYVARHRQILWPTVLVGVLGMFTTNLPVTLAAYAKSVFHSGPGGYGLLSSVLAVGSLSGALISTRRPLTRLRGLVGIGMIIAALQMLAAAASGQWSFSLVVAAVGVTAQLLLTSANSTVQLAARDSIRGRVMGVYLLVFVGGGALGGPLLGWVGQHLGPRIGMLLAGAVPAAATILVAVKLLRSRPAAPPAAAGSTSERPSTGPAAGHRVSRVSPVRRRDRVPVVIGHRLVIGHRRRPRAAADRVRSSQ